MYGEVQFLLSWRDLVGVAGGAGHLLPVGPADPLRLLVEAVGVAEAVPGGGQEGDGDVGPGQEVLHVLGEMVDVPHDGLVTVTVPPHRTQPGVTVGRGHLVEAGPVVGQVGEDVGPQPPVVRGPGVDVIKLRLPVLS